LEISVKIIAGAVMTKNKGKVWSYAGIGPIVERLGKKYFFKGWLRPITSFFVNRFHLFGYCFRSQLALVDKRPHYAYCLAHGAKLAKVLGYDRISVVEFGVAGGNGLLNLELHARKISEELGITIEVYGFDTGKGLPAINDDYRDMPYIWKPGFYQMDYEKLTKRLHSAKLVIGDVRETVKDFFEKYNPAPIAAVMFDMDLYSSTSAALKMFEADDTKLLPRIFTYFDDIGLSIESSSGCFNDFTGERLAINEFNNSHETKKICPQYALLTDDYVDNWKHLVFVVHSFKHKDYNTFISGEKNQQQELTLE
jgi:hypothetical protein